MLAKAILGFLVFIIHSSYKSTIAKAFEHTFYFSYVLVRKKKQYRDKSWSKKIYKVKYTKINIMKKKM